MADLGSVESVVLGLIDGAVQTSQDVKDARIQIASELDTLWNDHKNSVGDPTLVPGSGYFG